MLDKLVNLKTSDKPKPRPTKPPGDDGEDMEDYLRPQTPPVVQPKPGQYIISFTVRISIVGIYFRKDAKCL